jgi:hypothetical protein
MKKDMILLNFFNVIKSIINVYTSKRVKLVRLDSNFNVLYFKIYFGMPLL